MRVLLTTLLVAGFANGCAQESEPLLLSADRHFRAGNFAAAIADADQQLLLLPDDVPTLILRGKAKTAAGDFAGAIQDFSRVIELSPDDPEAYYSREIVYRRSGEAELAKADGDRARERDPLHKRAYAFESLSRNRTKPRSTSRSTADASADAVTDPALPEGLVDSDVDANGAETGEAYAADEDREFAEMVRQQKSDAVEQRIIKKDLLAAPRWPERTKRPTATLSGPLAPPSKQRDPVALGGPQQNKTKGTASQPEPKKPVLSTALPQGYTPGGAGRPATGLVTSPSPSGGINPWLNRPPTNTNGNANVAKSFQSRAGLPAPYQYRPGPVVPSTKGGTKSPSLSTSLDFHGVAPQGYANPIPTTGTPNERPAGRATVLPPPVTTTLPNR